MSGWKEKGRHGLLRNDANAHDDEYMIKLWNWYTRKMKRANGNLWSRIWQKVGKVRGNLMEGADGHGGASRDSRLSSDAPSLSDDSKLSS